MKPKQSFMSRIMSTLQNIWGKNEPVSPLQVSAQAPKPTAEPTPTQGKTKEDYINEGWIWSSMTPEEKARANVIRQKLGLDEPSSPPVQQGQVMGQQSPMPSPTPYPQFAGNPQPTAAPGIDNAMDFLTSQMPASSTQTPQEYYPPLGNSEFMQKIMEADKKRQGLASLLLLQAFNESTVGRAQNGGNLFGELPGGEGANNPASFNSYTRSLDSQLGPGVLGGGANPNMNILNEGDNSPLTPARIQQLYESYNPNSSYLEGLLNVMFNK